MEKHASTLTPGRHALLRYAYLLVVCEGRETLVSADQISCRAVKIPKQVLCQGACVGRASDLTEAGNVVRPSGGPDWEHSQNMG